MAEPRKVCLWAVAIQELHWPPGRQTNSCVCLRRLRCTKKPGPTKFSRRTIAGKPQFDLIDPACVQRREVEVKSLAVPRVESLPNGPRRNEWVLVQRRPTLDKRASFVECSAFLDPLQENTSSLARDRNDPCCYSTR